MHLNVVTDQDLFLEGVPPAAPPERGALATRERREDVVEVEAAGAAEAALPSESVEGVACAAERITAARGAAGIEASRAELVKLLLLLGVGKNLIGGLDVAELLLGRSVLVGIRVELFREAVVRFLDLGRRCRLVDAEGLVRVLLG